MAIRSRPIIGLRIGERLQAVEPPAPGPSIIVQDSFTNDTGSDSSLANDPPETDTTGNGWTVAANSSATVLASGDYVELVRTSGINAAATVDPGALGVAMRCSHVAGDNVMMATRFADEDNMYQIQWLNSGTVRLIRRVSGSGSVPVSSTGHGAPEYGDVLWVEDTGDAIRVGINDGSALLDHSTSDLNQNTQVGLSTQGLTLSVDNFALIDQPDHTELPAIGLVADSLLTSTDVGGFWYSKIRESVISSDGSTPVTAQGDKCYYIENWRAEPNSLDVNLRNAQADGIQWDDNNINAEQTTAEVVSADSDISPEVDCSDGLLVMCAFQYSGTPDIADVDVFWLNDHAAPNCVFEYGSEAGTGGDGVTLKALPNDPSSHTTGPLNDGNPHTAGFMYTPSTGAIDYIVDGSVVHSDTASDDSGTWNQPAIIVGSRRNIGPHVWWGCFVRNRGEAAAGEIDALHSELIQGLSFEGSDV